MKRRNFLAMAATALAGLAIDPEKLLWTPGAKKIFIPAAPRPIQAGDLIRLEYRTGSGTELKLWSEPEQRWLRVTDVELLGKLQSNQIYFDNSFLMFDSFCHNDRKPIQFDNWTEIKLPKNL